MRKVFLLANKNTSPTLVRANIFLLPGGHLWDADFLVEMEKDTQYFVCPMHHGKASLGPRVDNEPSVPPPGSLIIQPYS